MEIKQFMTTPHFWVLCADYICKGSIATAVLSPCWRGKRNTSSWHSQVALRALLICPGRIVASRSFSEMTGVSQILLRTTNLNTCLKICCNNTPIVSDTTEHLSSCICVCARWLVWPSRTGGKCHMLNACSAFNWQNNYKFCHSVCRTTQMFLSSLVKVSPKKTHFCPVTI